jgi:hypothetical protein
VRGCRHSAASQLTIGSAPLQGCRVRYGGAEFTVRYKGVLIYTEGMYSGIPVLFQFRNCTTPNCDWHLHKPISGRSSRSTRLGCRRFRSTLISSSLFGDQFLSAGFAVPFLSPFCYHFVIILSSFCHHFVIILSPVCHHFVTILVAVVDNEVPQNKYRCDV